MATLEIAETLDIIKHAGTSLVAQAIGFAGNPLGLQGEKKLSITALSQTLPDRLIGSFS